MHDTMVYHTVLYCTKNHAKSKWRDFSVDSIPTSVWVRTSFAFSKDASNKFLKFKSPGFSHCLRTVHCSAPSRDLDAAHRFCALQNVLSCTCTFLHDFYLQLSTSDFPPLLPTLAVDWQHLCCPRTLQILLFKGQQIRVYCMYCIPI